MQRAYRHRWPGPAAVLLLAGFEAAVAADLVVSTVEDVVGPDARCSLREAISSANADQAPFSGAGECVAGSGPDRITLPAGTYAVTRAGAHEDLNDRGDFDLRSSITLAGASATSTRISGGLLDRVLQVVGDGHAVTLRDLSISFGVVPDGPDNLLRRGGGLLAAGSSTTTLERVVVELNSGGSGTLPATAPGDGGGLACSGGARVFLRDSVVRLNSGGNARAGGGPAGGGGGIHGLLCDIEITRSRITDNTSGDGIAGGAAPGDGGGIAFGVGTLSVTDSVIADNAVGANGLADGGGIAGFAADVSLRGSSVVGNRAHRGGGVAGRVAADRAGLVLTVDNSTFSGNVATVGGALALREDGVLDLQAATVADNSAASGGAIAIAACRSGTCRLRFANSVFLRNGDGECALDGEVGESGGFNAFGRAGACGPALASDRVVDDGALGALDAGHAPTPVHVPPADSALIDAGSCAAAGTSVDQTGIGRPQQYPAADAADGCDIGAVERRTEALFADGFE